jgi:hypothetical protein
MRNLSRFFSLSVAVPALLLALILASAFAPSAAANTVYTYTGAPYSQCYGTYVATCSSLSLTGTLDLTLSLSQLENLNDFIVPASDVASFSFSDGFAASLNQSTAAYSLFIIDTNSQGQITNWGVALLSVIPTAQSTTEETMIIFVAGVTSDSLGIVNGELSGNDINWVCNSATKIPPLGCSFKTSSIVDGGGEQGSKGIWSLQGTTGPTPEPSSLLLLGTGLLGLGLLPHRRGT